MRVYVNTFSHILPECSNHPGGHLKMFPLSATLVQIADTNVDPSFNSYTGKNIYSSSLTLLPRLKEVGQLTFISGHLHFYSLLENNPVCSLRLNGDTRPHILIWQYVGDYLSITSQLVSSHPAVSQGPGLRQKLELCALWWLLNEGTHVCWMCWGPADLYMSPSSTWASWW